MTKPELIEELAKEMDLSINISSFIVDTILSAMTETLVNDNNVEIRGLGSFSVRKYGSYAPTPILKPPVDDYKVESAVPFYSD